MRTILVVEPHAATLELVADELQLAGFRVLRAPDGPAGYELYLQDRPQAVLLAVDVPRIGDMSLGKRLRESAGGARIPLVAVDKAHLGKALGVQAVLDTRCDAYLADPTRPALLEKLRELLAHAPAASDGPSIVLARAPELSGPLDPVALTGKLVSMALERRSGILVARSRHVERRLYLLEGLVVGFDSTARMETPIRWLHGTGRITPEQAGAALAAMSAEGLSTGAALVATGAMDAAAVGAFRRDHHRAGAALVLGMRDGRFQLHVGSEHAPADPAPTPVNACVLEAARSVFTARSCARALAPHLAGFPRLTAAFQDDLPALRLEPDELAAARLLDGSATLRDLLGSGRGELRQRYALYFALSACGYVEYLGAQDTSPGKVSPRPAPAAPRLPPEQAERIREAAVRALTGSYFQVLGLSIAATTEDVERAYAEVAARFHPDVFAGYELGALGEVLASLQDRIDAAHRVLSSEPRRQAYVEHVLRRLEPRSRSAAVVPEAEVEVQRGIDILEADPRAAAAAFERAIARSPKEPAYYAYLAWARFRGATVGSPEDRARDAMRVIRKGLAARPDDDRLIAILGILEAESGNPAEARRHLAQALRLNEGNRLARAALRRINRLPA